MKFARLAVIVMLTAAFLAGCGKSVVGTWEAKDQPGVSSVILVFNKDKTGSMTMTWNKERLEAMEKKTGHSIDAKYTVLPIVWEQNGDKITVHSKEKPFGGSDSVTIDMPDSKTLVIKDPAGKNPSMTFTRK